MAIDQTTVFDIAALRPSSYGTPDRLYLYLRSAVENFPATRIAHALETYRLPAYTRTSGERFDFDNPEFAEIQRRIDNGTCELMFYLNDVLIGWDDAPNHTWFTKALAPIHPEIDSSDFFAALGHHADFVKATDRWPNRFQFPGITEGAQRRYYKREDGAAAPNMDHAAATSFALLGWTPDIPFGPYRLHAIDVLDTPKSVAISEAQRIYHRRKDLDGAIVDMARAWHRYWRELPSDFQNNPVRRTLREHVEHAIGRMWADRPLDDAIDVFYEGRVGAIEREARDAEDWMLGNMECWAHDWGFPALALAIGEGSNRSLLDVQLGDYTFCHINLGGTIGDRLSNGADGITEATWDAYQDTHYPAAVNHGVDALAVETLTIIVHQGSTETAQLTVTGGLAPHEFVLTQTETWASIDDATGEITVAPDTTVTVQDYTLRVRITDDLGTVVNADVTVTVNAAPSEE